MGLQVEVALLFIINVIWFQHTLCDGSLTNSNADRWTCTCFIEDSNFVPANCSSSCVISTLLQATDGRVFARLADNDKSCFASCNCEGGPIKFDEGIMSNETILIIGFLVLLILVVLIPGIGIVAILLWNHWKHKRIHCV